MPTTRMIPTMATLKLKGQLSSSRSNNSTGAGEGSSPQTSKADLHRTHNKHSNDCKFCCPGHGKTQEDPKGQRKHQKVGKDRDARCNNVERVVNALRIRVLSQRKIPVCREWNTLEQGRKEDGDCVKRVEDVQGVNRISHRLFVPTEAKEENEDRGFDKGEDWVVEHLDEKVPPVAGPWVEVGDIFFVPSPVVQLHDCRSVSMVWLSSSFLRLQLTHEKRSNH